MPSRVPGTVRRAIAIREPLAFAWTDGQPCLAAIKLIVIDVSDSGKCHDFTVWLASSNASRDIFRMVFTKLIIHPESIAEAAKEMLKAASVDLHGITISLQIKGTIMAADFVFIRARVVHGDADNEPESYRK